MVPGGIDEVSGKKTFAATVAADGSSVSLRLVVPGCMKEHGSDVRFTGLRFGHGHDAVVAAIGDTEVERPKALAYPAEARALVAENHRVWTAAGLDKEAVKKAFRKACTKAVKQAPRRPHDHVDLALRA